MNAGYHGLSWAAYPTEYDYMYPIVWEGELTGCVISEGDCMALGTSSSDDFASQQCYNYVCEDTQIYCPPRGLPSCPGGANNCDTPAGEDKMYQMHKCNVTPLSNKDFQISCLKDSSGDNSFVCFYKQTGGYAPLSMTCKTGGCLYNNTNSSGRIHYGDTERAVPLGLDWQEESLILVTGSILGVALALEVARRQVEAKKEAAFRRYQRRREAAAQVVAAAGRGGGGLLGDTRDAARSPLIPARATAGLVEATASNPLHGGAREHSGSTADSEAASEAASGGEEWAEPKGSAAEKKLEARAAGTAGGGGRERAGSAESSDSGYEEGRRFRGAVLSWHSMCLWVPASASDQLGSIAASASAGLRRLPSWQGGPDEAAVPAGAHPRRAPAGARGRVREGAAPANAHVLEKQILRNVSGTATRGGLTALMGPSGAGKTSLLDCLACRKPMHRVEGTITVNGRPCPGHRMRDVSGYVPQHDVLPGVLTVREHLLFHARLRCPPAMRDVDRRARVHDVIEMLGLSKCAETQIGNEFKRGLSGGEKRRVSVAEELVVEPGILFLDEPTTGLDSSTVSSL